MGSQTLHIKDDSENKSVMPPEPPPSKSNDMEDTINEDAGVHQAQLDGYQLLAAQAPDASNDFSDTSESSSDEDEDEHDLSAGHHHICMTINWPADGTDQQLSHEATPPASTSSASQPLRPDQAGLSPDETAQCGDQNDQPADREDPPADGNKPPADRKDPCAGRKVPPADRNDPPVDRKDPSADWKNPPEDRKDPPADRISLSEDQTAAVRLAMQGVRLPDVAVPDWARGLSDQQCRQQIGQMVARLTADR